MENSLTSSRVFLKKLIFLYSMLMVINLSFTRMFFFNLLICALAGLEFFTNLFTHRKLSNFHSLPKIIHSQMRFNSILLHISLPMTRHRLNNLIFNLVRNICMTFQHKLTAHNLRNYFFAGEMKKKLFNTL